jgi:chorismate mutase
MTTALNPPVPEAARVEHPIRTTPEPAIAATSTPNEPPTEQAPEIPVPVPVDQAGIDVLRTEIDEIDAELVRLILRRTAVSHAIGAARRSLGGPRIVYSREMAVLQRFRDLGPAGTDLGMLLLAMGRGKLGRK